MSSTIIKTTFQFKRGDAARWTELNPILAPGEPGFELDTGKLKIGNGSTYWNDLPYMSGGTGELSVDGKSLIIRGDSAEIYGFSSAAVGQVPTKGSDGKIAWTNPAANPTALTEEEIRAICQ